MENTVIVIVYPATKQKTQLELSFVEGAAIVIVYPVTKQRPQR